VGAARGQSGIEPGAGTSGFQGGTESNRIDQADVEFQTGPPDQPGIPRAREGDMVQLSRPIITLISDFGLNDPFVGVLKGVIYSINPEAVIVDITHGIASHDILEAALVVRSSYAYFPPGTIHVAVVDPGVGTSRRPLLLVSENHCFVGPDNGIFWPTFQSVSHPLTLQLTEEEYFLRPVSHTFHGRDIFAPVAAWLSKGVDPRKMGQPMDTPTELNIPAIRKIGNSKLIGTILRLDKFGNVITNLTADDLPSSEGASTPYVIHIGSRQISQYRRSYAGATPGELFVIWGSSGRLEISVNQASAASLLDARKGQEFDVEIRALSPSAPSGIMEW
jgi:S-adenosylmethionine hydrolase